MGNEAKVTPSFFTPLQVTRHPSLANVNPDPDVFVIIPHSNTHQRCHVDKLPSAGGNLWPDPRQPETQSGHRILGNTPSRQQVHLSRHSPSPLC